MPTVPSAFIAARLLARRQAANATLLYVCGNESRAAQIAALIGGLDARAPALFFPAWDCLPYDRSSPSAEVMGARMAVLRRLALGVDRPIVVATPAAIVQRLPRRTVVSREPLAFEAGAAIDPQAVTGELERLGYRAEDRVDEPGRYAVRGEVLDIYGAADRLPHRIDVAHAAITAVRTFDPLSQRTLDAVDRALILPASEVVFEPGEESAMRAPGLEHALADLYPTLQTVFDYLPERLLLLEPAVEARGREALAQAAAAYADRLRFGGATPDASEGPLPSAPDRLYLTAAEWEERAGEAQPLDLDGFAPVPRFALERSPGRALSAFARESEEAGRRILLSAASKRDLAKLSAAAGRGVDTPAQPIEGWPTALEAQPGALLTVALDADAGFIDEKAAVVLVTAADLLGSRAATAGEGPVQLPWRAAAEVFASGDVVIHEDHGLGVLQGLERVDAGAMGVRETVRIAYAKEAGLLAPLDELGRIWRYSSEAAGVALDRLDSDAWLKRREKIHGEIAHLARDLVALAKARDAASAPVLEPPRREYEAFAARFPFTPTADQQAAIDASLADLASGRPMDRLVVGDVGFGKTEVALRAAVAAVLAGKQAAVVAPTTVLVRQHLETFRRRFAEVGMEVAHLSRLVSPAEGRKAKAALADGSVRLVVGTHALAGDGVSFADLGLLIIDEEHRFGAADKARLRSIADGVHALSLSATPIPRTLQTALVGLQDLSIIATPPARRRPIRTFVETFDPATVRTALLREAARGGQSFVVVPRIEDIEAMRTRLAEVVPKLKLVVVHGKMPAAEVDEAIVGFAEGRGQVMLATNIIESGLDVPRANTMLVCDPDRFGLAQLHQLRGRVGRGRVQGVCYLLTDPERPISEATLGRLETLSAFDRLGAGLEISAQDLDQRGAGDLLGEAQAGHVNLIGLGLYQHLLELAIRSARGEAVDDWTPEIHIESGGELPPDYIPEEMIRLNLYARLARAVQPDTLEDLADEIEDRFGPPPPAVLDLLGLARVRSLCRRWGVARVDGGPQAVAFSFREGAAALPALVGAMDASADLTWKGERLIWARATENGAEQVRLAETMLGGLE